MASSEILLQENAIILASMEKFVELGQEASEKIINGKTPEKQDAKAEQILQLLTAYRRKAQLSDDNLESLLYALKQLSAGSSFPTIDPIVGQSTVYRVTGITDDDGEDSGGGGTGEPAYRGDYNPASGNPPGATTGSGEAGAIIQGDEYYATTASSVYGEVIGNVFGQDVYHGCLFKARVNGAGASRADWYLSQDGF